jgi:hypothetical protein
MAHDERALAYLQHVLAHEPRRHAQAMLDLRARRLGGSVPVRTARAVLREEARAALASLRCDVWSLDAEAFAGRAREVGAGAFADLGRELARLGVASRRRADVEALAAAPGVDRFVVEGLRDLLSQPRAMAVAQRDALLRHARAQRWRRRRALRRAARVAARRLSDLGPIEYEFVARLRRLEAERRLCREANRTRPRSPFDGLSRLFGIVVLILCLMAVAFACYAVLFHR